MPKEDHQPRLAMGIPVLLAAFIVTSALLVPSAHAQTVVATVPVGTGIASSPAGIVYDSAKGELFVSNTGEKTVSVISDATSTTTTSTTPEFPTPLLAAVAFVALAAVTAISSRKRSAR